jgi:hypothetical protein
MYWVVASGYLLAFLAGLWFITKPRGWWFGVDPK